MLVQMLLLPLYLGLFIAPELFDVIDVTPFIEAFLLLILTPLTLAAITQYLATRFAAARRVMELTEALAVPLMMATLALVAVIGTVT